MSLSTTMTVPLADQEPAPLESEPQSGATSRTLDWTQLVPYLLLHLACLAVVFTGWSYSAVGVALALYFARVFALTAFYHRYFSHRAFKTSRWFQFAGALLGNSAAQRGPLWWAAHHRVHHRLSDMPGDLHSPHQDGFFWSHMFWFITKENHPTNLRMIPDFARYPELRFLDRFEHFVPIVLAALLYGLGDLARRFAPGLGTNGPQLLLWGFVISTVAVYHVTYSINSLAHLFGRRRFETRDSSRNNFALALVTFGEGWHNNHHRYPNSARQGFYAWEIDVTYYILLVLERVGLVWELHPVPARVLDEGRARESAERRG